MSELSMGRRAGEGRSLEAVQTRDSGFLRGETFLAPPDSGVSDELQADGHSRTRTIADVYVRKDASASLNLTCGFDYLRHTRKISVAANFAKTLSHGQ